MKWGTDIGPGHPPITTEELARHYVAPVENVAMAFGLLVAAYLDDVGDCGVEGFAVWLDSVDLSMFARGEDAEQRLLAYALRRIAATQPPGGLAA